jgi:hypothetical protein
MNCKQDERKTKNMEVMLKIGGKRIGLVPFVHNALRDMIVAFTNNLKGHSGGDIEITVRAPKQK